MPNASRYFLALAILAFASAHAQGINSPAAPPPASPATATPPHSQLDSPTLQPGTDRSALGSLPGGSTALPAGTTLRIGTPVSIILNHPVNSGSSMNGQSVHGRLAEPVRTSSGAVLPLGTAVDATIVSSAKAGVVASGGVLSLQLTHVGRLAIVSDVLDFNGGEGHKDIADGAPAKGSEAMVAEGTVLHFKVLETGHVPGLAPAKPISLGTP